RRCITCWSGSRPTSRRKRSARHASLSMWIRYRCCRGGHKKLLKNWDSGVWAGAVPSSRGGRLWHQENFGEAYLRAAAEVVAYTETWLVSDHPVRSFRGGFASFFEVASTPPHEEPVLVKDQSWLDGVFNVEHGKDVSRLEPGTGTDVSADTDGFRRAG